MTTYELDSDDVWRIRRALKVYANYLDNVFEGDEDFGDAYREIATRLKAKKKWKMSKVK